MKTIRPPKRSVSPFVLSGDFDPSTSLSTPFEQALYELKNTWASEFGSASPEDLAQIPNQLSRLAEAPANDAPVLAGVCNTILKFQETLKEKKAWACVLKTMTELFFQKVQLFMIDHYNQEHCQKMGWAVDHKDVVLFSKERDILIGVFFAPLADTQPGLFSEFISKWIDTENPDRCLHFLDFCAGSKNPTFEHYLLFSHPALARILRDKTLLRGLFEKSSSLLKKLASPTWDNDTRSALGV